MIFNIFCCDRRPGTYNIHSACMVGFSSKKVEQLEIHRRQHEDFLKNREYVHLTSSIKAGSRVRKSKRKYISGNATDSSQQRCKQCNRACKCQDICNQILELKSLTNEFTNTMESEKAAIGKTVQKLSNILQSLPPPDSLHFNTMKGLKKSNKNPQVMFQITRTLTSGL